MWFKDIREDTRIIMQFYRKAIEDLEVEEYEKVNEVIEEGLAKVPKYQPIYYFDEPAYFVEVLPKEKKFSVSFDGDNTSNLDYCEIYNIKDR